MENKPENQLMVPKEHAGDYSVGQEVMINLTGTITGTSDQGATIGDIEINECEATEEEYPEEPPAKMGKMPKAIAIIMSAKRK